MDLVIMVKIGDEYFYLTKTMTLVDDKMKAKVMKKNSTAVKTLEKAQLKYKDCFISER